MAPVTAGSERILELAREHGFDLAGLAPLAPPPDADRFEAWLEAGRHADMTWLERNRARILDPRKVVEGPGTILVLGVGHARGPVGGPDGSRIARYAAGRDYHNVVGKQLKRLTARLRAEGLLREDRRARGIVDAGPVLERSHAARAGLGSPSKAANLLHPDFGPWFFLAELLLQGELEPTAADAAPASGRGGEQGGRGPHPVCGTCTACIDACPTSAIVAPGQVDARRCISYQTIENRGSIPRELRADHGAWVFGCDVCSEVCPYGRGEHPPALAERFGLHRAVGEGDLVTWLTLDEPAWDALTLGSPLRRARRAGLARNAAIVLGNVPSEGGRRALLRALTDKAATVREAAGWALARAHGESPAVRSALEGARGRETDPRTRADLELDLEELDGERLP